MTTKQEMKKTRIQREEKYDRYDRKLLPKNHPLVKDIERYIAKRGVIRLLEKLEREFGLHPAHKIMDDLNKNDYRSPVLQSISSEEIYHELRQIEFYEDDEKGRRPYKRSRGW